MAYTIKSPIGMEDVPSLARTNMSAFHQDEHWRRIWSGMPLEEIIEGTRHRLPRLLVSGRDRKRHQVAIDRETGDVVGYARWVISPRLMQVGSDGEPAFWPEAQVAEPTPEDRQIYEDQARPYLVNGRPKGAQSEMIGNLGAVLDAEDKRTKGNDEWLELEYLTVHPDHQRRGVGEMLVRSGVRQADAVQVYTTVMASTLRGQNLYKRCGFELVSTIVQDDSKWGGSADGSVNCWYKRPIHATQEVMRAEETHSSSTAKEK